MDKRWRAENVRGGQWVSAVVLLMLTSACERSEVSAQVGPEGGTLSLRLGRGQVTIEVPPGALDTKLTLTASAVSEVLPGAAGRAIELGPHGTVFKKPVRLRFEPGPGDLPTDMPASRLRVATRAGTGDWEFLPTGFPQPRTIEGRSTHFSLFALVAPCQVVGVGDDFPLTGCSTFDPRIQTSAQVSLNARAGNQTLVFSVSPGPQFSSAPVAVTVSGLTPSATYFLLRDGAGPLVALPTSSLGALQFAQDVTSRHLLVLMARHGSLGLQASTCAPPIGQWDAASSTCTLTQDLVDPPLYIEQDGLTLDCADPTTGQRHVIGGSAPTLGISVIGRTDVRIRNCEVENADFGILSSGATRLSIENVRIHAPVSAGTQGAMLHGQDLAITDLVVDNVEVGVGTDDMTGLTIRRATFRTSSVAAHLFHVGGLRLEDVTVDGALSDGLVSLPDDEVPLGAVVLEGLSGATVRNLTGVRLGGYQTGLAAVFDADAELAQMDVRGARTGIRLDGPADSLVTDSLLTANRIGLTLLGGANLVFHNDVHDNTQRQVFAAGPTALWDGRVGSPTSAQGNYWGHACPGPLFVPGVDSNRPDVSDAFPFASPSGWVTAATPGCILPAPVLSRPSDQSTIGELHPEFAGSATPMSTIELSEAGVVLGVVTASSGGTFALRPATALREGPHFITAVARLGAMQSDKSAPLRFIIDAQAPAQPAITFPNGGSTLNEATVVISGEAEAQSLVTLFDGTVVLASVSANAEGRFEASARLGQGAHSLRASATDVAGNTSAPSASVGVVIASAMASAPLRGAAGKLVITSVGDAPDPFVPVRGEANELRVLGYLDRSTGAQAGQQYFARIERVVRDSTGTAVRTLASDTQLPFIVGGTTPIELTIAWDGRRDDGSAAVAGQYLSDASLTVIRLPRPGNSGIAPPDCHQSTSLSGPCVLDRLHLVTHLTLVSVVPAGRSDYRSDPALSLAQRQTLTRLEQQSSSPLFVQSWARAGTIYRLDLEVASGAPTGAGLRDHARAFVAQNLGLWRLQSIAQLEVFDSYPGGDCSAVTFQLVQDGLPVFNATLTVLVSSQGRIRSITGRMTGDRFPVRGGHLTAEGARTLATNALEWPEDVADFGQPIAAPVATIFDAMFVYDGPHEAQESFVFTESPWPGGPMGLSTRRPGGVVVGAATGAVEFAGPAFSASETALAPAKCGFFDATIWTPEIVLDPLTGTPAWVNLHHLSGLKVPGGTDLERAYSFLSHPAARYFWGDARPREHLRDGVVALLENGARQVTFQEYQAGIRVDGAYLSVVLDHDRVVSALARFVYAPSLPAPGAVPLTPDAARLLAEDRWVSAECGTDLPCNQRYRDFAATQPAAAAPVLLSPAIYEGWSTSTEDRLAFRFELPGRVVFIDGISGAVLLDWSTDDSATFAYQVWSPPGLVAATKGDRIRGTEGYGGYTKRAAAPVGGPIQIFSPSGPDVPAAGRFVEAVSLWFDEELGYRGITGDGGVNAAAGVDLQVYVNDLDDPENARASTVIMQTASSGRSQFTIDTVLLGRNVMALDVYAHEYMHVVTGHGVGFGTYLEPGALDESYSDLAAVVIAPAADGGWDLGTETLRAIRDGRPLRNFLHPGMFGEIEHVSEQRGCDPLQDTTGCRHAWKGIPNRAAALVAVGLPAWPNAAFGRRAMAELFLRTVIPAPPITQPGGRDAPTILTSTDRFLNQRVKVVERCKQLETVRLPLKGFAPGRKIEAADCDFVGAAFDEVGVLGVRSSNLRFRPGHGPENQTVTVNSGMELKNGCTLQERVLRVEFDLRTNPPRRVQLQSSSLDIPALLIVYPNDPNHPNDWQLRVEGRSVLVPGTTDRSFTYEVTTKWVPLVENQFYTVFVDERFARPASIPADEACLSGPGTVLRELWSTPIASSWSTFLDGNRVDVAVNSNQTSPCKVAAVLGIHEHKGDAVDSIQSPIQEFDHGNHGFRVFRPAGLSEFALDADLHIWHDAFSGIFARVVYLVEKPEGAPEAFCVVPGTFQVTR